MSLTFHANGLITGSKITMPEGSGCKGAVIQRVKVERGGNAGTTDVSRNSNGGWDDVNTVSFTPFYSNSIINMYMNYSVGAQANADFYFRFAYQPSGGSDTEIERTGIQRITDTQDALSTRFAWSHQWVQGNTSAYTYKLQGYKNGGGGAVLWYHTYGSQTTSIFEITEIKQ
tara:strand:- start:1102 stop:1617 length:516 start_codon:yes stop_codon:yes gene_type:complete